MRRPPMCLHLGQLGRFAFENCLTLTSITFDMNKRISPERFRMAENRGWKFDNLQLLGSPAKQQSQRASSSNLSRQDKRNSNHSGNRHEAVHLFHLHSVISGISGRRRNRRVAWSSSVHRTLTERHPRSLDPRGQVQAVRQADWFWPPRVIKIDTM